MIETIAVIGAGTMGNGIAHVCAQHGCRVTLVDLSEQLLQRGMEIIAKNLSRQVAREVLTRDEADATLGRIYTTTELAEVKGVQLVVEAVSESTAPAPCCCGWWPLDTWAGRRRGGRGVR